MYVTDSTEHGGAEDHLKSLATYFHQHGFDVRVVLPPCPGTVRLVDEIRKEGIEVDYLSLLPLDGTDVKRTRRALLRNLFGFCSYFLKARPHLVHFVSPWPTRDVWCAMLSAFLLRLPYIVDFQLVPPVIQCPPTTKGILKHLCKILRFLFNRAECLICPSRGNKERLIRFFDLTADRIQVVHNGVEVEKFQKPDLARVQELRREFGLVPQPTVVTTVARLNVQKGHEGLIKAAALVAKGSDDIVFLAVGDGELRQSLESLAGRMGLTGKFKFAGHRKDIPEILSLTDIFVLPTLFEGLPHSVLEAMAAGRCVVASRVDGVEEVVYDGETGILVEAGNVSQLVDTLRWLAARKDEREEMGRRGKERVNELFALDRMLEQTERLYQKILVA